MIENYTFHSFILAGPWELSSALWYVKNSLTVFRVALGVYLARTKRGEFMAKKLTHDILTTDQAAEYLQVTRQTILRGLRCGRLPGAKVGSRWRLSRAALEAYAAGAWRPSTNAVT